jgi:hypothetical protein
MKSWDGTTRGQILRSPCVSNGGTSPDSIDGQPAPQTHGFGDGQLRDLGAVRPKRQQEAPTGGISGRSPRIAQVITNVRF